MGCELARWGESGDGDKGEFAESLGDLVTRLNFEGLLDRLRRSW